jgi:CheY-like chemotaxis protein
LDNQRLIGLLLAKAGLNVDVAEDGEKACRLAAESQEQGKPYDLILMDMQMPRVDGYEATGRLRREGWTGPIIALTAHAMSGDRERCLDVGCTDYLSKPVQRDVLLDRVARHLQPDEVPHTQ